MNQVRTHWWVLLVAGLVLCVAWVTIRLMARGDALAGLDPDEVVAIEVVGIEDRRTATVPEAEHAAWCDAIKRVSDVRRMDGEMYLLTQYLIKVQRESGTLVIGCNEDGSGVYQSPGATRWEVQMRCPELLKMVRALLADPQPATRGR